MRRRTSRRRACRPPGTPTAPGAPASASVRVSSVSAGTVAVGIEHDPVVGRLEPVLVDERARAADRAGSRAGSPSRRSPARLPFTDGSTRNRPSAPRARAARPTARPGGYDGASSARRRASARSAPSRWKRARPRAEKYSRGTLSGRRTGSRRRTETTSAPAASAFSHSVAAAMPAPTTVTLDRVLVRLVRVDDARVAAQLLRHVQPRMTGREQHVPEDAVPVELEAAVDRAHALDARVGARSASQPLRSRSSSTCARNSVDASGGSGRERRDERRRRAPPPRRRAPRARGTTSAGSARRSRSASRAGGSPPRAAARPPPGRRRVRRRRSPPARARRGAGSGTR